MFGSPETTSGGNALKFYASIRLDIRKIGNIQEGDKIVGTRHRVKVKKNKVAPPFKQCEFDMDINGISMVGDVIDLAVEHLVINKAGSFFKYGDEVIAQGRESAKTYLTENPEFMKKIQKQIWTKIKEENDL